MNKKILTSLVLIICVFALTIGTTLAWLTAQSEKIENTFAVGDINITLTETNPLDLKMVPGKTITKDPVVTVQAGSEDCYLFVKLEKVNGFDTYMTFEKADGWEVFEEVAGEYIIYCRVVSSNATENQPFDVIKGHKITVKSELTKNDLANAKTSQPQLNIQAFAVQQLGSADAAEAWEKLTTSSGQ